jgi:hypothetical protein
LARDEKVLVSLLLCIKQLTMSVKDFRETKAYRLAFEVAMEIFEISKTFPRKRLML